MGSGVNILSWTAVIGGCGYYRIQRPFEELARHGHAYRIPDVEISAPDIEDVLESDVVVVQRRTAEPVYALWRWLRAATGVPMVYEIDDDIWSIDIDNPPLASFLHPQVGEWAHRFIAESDLVTVSTAPLAERVSRWNRNVVVLPNCLDAAAFDLPRPAPRDDGRVTVGWTCSASHVTDLRSVLAPWRELFTSRPDLELHVMGVDYRPTLGIPGVRHTPWRSDLMDYYSAIDFDIGLAPLAPLEFNASKSALKIVEYGARGIPCVASDIGPYRGFVEHGVTGFLVRGPEDWARYVGALADDPAMRAEMGAAARKVSEGFIIQERWTGWESAYWSALR